MQSNKTTVEPRLTTTPFIRPYSFEPNVKSIESLYYFEDPVNATTSLLRPGFYGPTVVALTGFHCISKWDKIYWFVRDRSENVTSLFEKFSLETLHLKMKVLMSNSENREHLKMSGMLIVYWPITMKFRIRKQTSKPQTYYRCCLRFSYLSTYWLISCNTITFHKYFWCSRWVSQ